MMFEAHFLIVLIQAAFCVARVVRLIDCSEKSNAFHF